MPELSVAAEYRLEALTCENCVNFQRHQDYTETSPQREGDCTANPPEYLGKPGNMEFARLQMFWGHPVVGEYSPACGQFKKREGPLNV